MGGLLWVGGGKGYVGPSQIIRGPGPCTPSPSSYAYADPPLSNKVCAVVISGEGTNLGRNTVLILFNAPGVLHFMKGRGGGGI